MHISDQIKVADTNLADLNSREIEQIWRVIIFGNDRILLGCLYGPPNSNDVTNRIINKTITYAKNKIYISFSVLKSSSVLITGDLNFPIINYDEYECDSSTATIGSIRPTIVNNDKASAQLFLDMLDDNYLSQMVTFPTYRNSIDSPAKNTLDLVLTNEPDRVFEVACDAPLGHTPQ